jgi:hypothetical protein
MILNICRPIKSEVVSINFKRKGIKLVLREKQRSLSFDKGIDKLNWVEIEGYFEAVVLERCTSMAECSSFKIPLNKLSAFGDVSGFGCEKIIINDNPRYISTQNGTALQNRNNLNQKISLIQLKP